MVKDSEGVYEEGKETFGNDGRVAIESDLEDVVMAGKIVS